ncbi:hypothetical protein ACFU90_07190 [Streptomyces noursei]|uniref:hypothetical protein n=1 Tax=Streptomyces noursei TaxID=1971 RepID=UPI0033C162AA
MREVTEERMLWLLHSDTSSHHPQLTLVAIDGADASRAERTARTAFERTPAPRSWLESSPLVRRRLVGACRTVPTIELIHLADVEPAHLPEESFRLCLSQIAEEGPGGRFVVALTTVPQDNRATAAEAARGVLRDRIDGFASPEQWVGLRALAALTNVVCRETATVDLPDDEDLLAVYDRYTVGELTSASD